MAVIGGLGDVWELPLRHEVDARAVDRGRDRPREVSSIVARVVPGEAALAEAVLPERNSELHRLDGLLAVEHHLHLVVDLGATEAPRHGVAPLVGIAQAVTAGRTEPLVFR